MLLCKLCFIKKQQTTRFTHPPKPQKKELLRRSYDLPSSFIHSRPTLEIIRLTGQRLLGSRFESGPIDRVYHTIDRLTAKMVDKQHPKGVYGYEDGALESFLHAKNLDVHKFYELPIVYWKTLHRALKEQIEKYPEWGQTMEFSRDSIEKCARKDHELELADSTLCPSEFVLESIPEKFKEKCSLLPYGAPPPFRNDERHDTKRPLRILFAGSMSQRKRLADLFSAGETAQHKTHRAYRHGKTESPY